VKLVPIDQLMAETDSPFLSPMPNRGALNVPAQVATVIRAMAAERGDDLAELANALSANAERAFGKFN
jgi:TatD DNase family protein